MRWVHYAIFFSKENVPRRGMRAIFAEDEVLRPEARNPTPRHVNPAPARTPPDQEMLMWRVRKTPRRGRCFTAGGLRNLSARSRFHGGGLRNPPARIRFHGGGLRNPPAGNGSKQEVTQEAKVSLPFFGFTTTGFKKVHQTLLKLCVLNRRPPNVVKIRLKF